MCFGRMAGRVKSEPYFTASLGISRILSTGKVFRLVIPSRGSKHVKLGSESNPKLKQTFEYDNSSH